MRFDDLATAGRELAERLRSFRGRDDVLVLAIARGGMPLAIEVARELDLPLDVIVRRTVVHVAGIEMAVALNVAGTLVLDDEVRAVIEGPETPERWNALDLLALLGRRTRACRADRAPVGVAGRTVLLIDNGVRTGDTVRSVIRGLRRLAPARVVLGLGAASQDARESLHAIADQVVCLRWPEGDFGHVGLWYRRFDVPSDEEIGARMQEIDRVAV
jgi:putative phosphoribosyl transferase